MFQALGRSARRNKDGSFVVKVELLTDDGKSLGFRTYTVATLKQAKDAALADLQALKDAENDAQLNIAIVNTLLAQI